MNLRTDAMHVEYLPILRTRIEVGDQLRLLHLVELEEDRYDYVPNKVVWMDTMHFIKEKLQLLSQKAMRRAGVQWTVRLTHAFFC